MGWRIVTPWSPCPGRDTFVQRVVSLVPPRGGPTATAGHFGAVARGLPFGAMPQMSHSAELQSGGSVPGSRLEVIDCHLHVIPWDVMTPGAKDLLRKGRDSGDLVRLREISHEPR